MITLDTVAAAVEVVESQGQWWVESRAGNRGVMQVHPKWANVTPAMLWIPEVNRAEGRRLLTYWHHQAHGRWAFALAAYNCGWGGLKGKCGKGYARRVLRITKEETWTGS